MNEKLAFEKGLITNKNDLLYLSLQNAYKYVFEKEILSKVNLINYNNLIKNSNLDFGIPHPKKSQLSSNLHEYLDLEYIYVINNFFIEKLNKEDLKTLNNFASSKDTIIDDEIVNLVKKTFSDVIKNNFLRGEYVEKTYQVCYGEEHPGNFADNDALVLKIFYSKNKLKMEGDEFIKNIREKKKFLQEISESIKKDIKDILNLNCNILIEKIPN